MLFLTSKILLAQTYGDTLFSSSQIHTINIELNQANWFDSLLATHAGDYYIPANVIVNGITYNNVGVKFKGNSSFNNPSIKKSMKIDFNIYDSTLALNGLKKINLNNGFKDPTFLREKICLDFLRNQGANAPRSTYANVYLNNQLWGFYLLVEEIDKTFLKDRFNNKNGNLFKGDPNGDLKYLGNNLIFYYPKYELHTNETVNDWNDLLNLISILNTTPAASLETSLENVFNLNTWYISWATNILFANLDSYQGSGHNYFIYHNTITDKFEFIAWDVNEAFGNFQQGMSLQQIKNLAPDYIPNPAGNRPLEEKLLALSSMKSDYYDVLYHMLSNGFDTTTMYPVIDSLADWIRPSVYADPNKFFTNNNFESNINVDLGNIPALKPFIPARINAVLPVLLSAGYSPLNISNSIAEKNNFKIFPNPASDIVYVYHESGLLQLFSIDGKLIKTFFTSGNLSALDISNLQSGVYILKNNKNDVVKLVVCDY